MKNDNIRELINKGIKVQPELIRDYSIILAVLYVFTFMWFFISNVIFVKIITIFIQIISIFMVPIIFKAASGQETIRKRLMTKLLFSIYVIINSTLFSIVIYIDTFGYTFNLIFLFLAPMGFSLFFYLCNEFKFIFLKRKHKKSASGSSVIYYLGGIGTIGVFAGILGRNFARIVFKDISIPAEYFYIFFFMFLACVFTISTGNIVKLKYLKRIEE